MFKFLKEFFSIKEEVETEVPVGATVISIEPASTVVHPSSVDDVSTCTPELVSMNIKRYTEAVAQTTDDVHRQNLQQWLDYWTAVSNLPQKGN